MLSTVQKPANPSGSSTQSVPRAIVSMRDLWPYLPGQNGNGRSRTLARRRKILRVSDLCENIRHEGLIPETRTSSLHSSGSIQVRGLWKRFQNEFQPQEPPDYPQSEPPAAPVYAVPIIVRLENLFAGSHETAHGRETVQV
uniref:(northern house mosquito) hypothetical protein n=1 Tax=Culex pipiens TaxID=7175 RepID=A0A8D8CED6_CULPI